MAMGTRGVPGPGQYHSNILVDGGTKYKFGSDSRMKLNYSKDRITPGPGNYDGDFDKFTRKDARTIFGKGKNRDDSFERRHSSLPGPGAYNQADSIGRGSPSKTMGGKH